MISAQTAFALGSAGVCAVTDLATGYVFDAVTLPTLAGLFFAAACEARFASALTGAIVAGGALAVLYAITRGRGLGLGDVKLACCIGAAFGAADSLRCLQVAFVLGGLYAAVMLVRRKAKRGDEMRFAPFMFVAMLAVLIQGAR
jgi:leader peptidase (prepilin peptidase)/N-methyltransferase